jgi:NinB protein
VKVVLYNAQQAHAAIMNLWAQIKGPMVDGQQYVIELREKTRSNEASAKFHAMCGDFAKSGIEWAGKRRTLAQWKVLLISGHAIATKEGAEMVPGLESEFVNIREESSKMSVKRMASLIEYTYAMGSNLGVKFSAPEYMEE